MGSSPRRTAVAGFALLSVLAVSSCGGRAPASQRTVEESAPSPTTLAAPVGDPTTTLVAPPATLPGGGYVSAITAEVVDNPAFDGFEADITGLMQQAGLPGASLLVVQHGQLVEQEAWMDYTLDTKVLIASGSKWLSAATIMTLVDDGTLALDEPISTYAPQIAGPNVRAITLRQLLSFTSGLADDDRVPCSEDLAYSLQQCAAEFIEAGVVHPPGATFRYGGQHLLVAAAIAEIVTGVPFAELFQQRIARPLGMSSTEFTEVGDYLSAAVDFPNPAGSARSTLGDYGRFLEMIYHEGLAPDGTRILQASTVAEMQTNQIAHAEYGTAAAFRVADESPYGLGEWLDWTRADGSALVVSSDGSFGFRPWLDKENDLFGVYLIQDIDSGYVEGDPSAASNDDGKVHTSGNWIFEMVAQAVGGSLPKDKYPDRS
ncbi:MAG: serine hydrolase domain-containing protein [Ilumatobacteraceae bacterium]